MGLIHLHSTAPLILVPSGADDGWADNGWAEGCSLWILHLRMQCGFFLIVTGSWGLSSFSRSRTVGRQYTNG